MKPSKEVTSSGWLVEMVKPEGEERSLCPYESLEECKRVAARLSAEGFRTIIWWYERKYVLTPFREEAGDDLAGTEPLRSTLKNLVVGIDRACISGETLEECLPETMQDPYEEARALLGDPVVMYPGGGVDAHYHYLGETSDDCYWCEQHAEE